MKFLSFGDAVLFKVNEWHRIKNSSTWWQSSS
jgi:hypothetical protein